MNLDDFLIPDEIYVIDTETTGLDGAPMDVVVDIGICLANFSTGEVRDVYSSVVGYNVTEWDDRRKKAWIFENTDMSLEMVAAAKPKDIVRDDVTEILRGKNVTSYNIPFDMDKFLFKQPWNLKGVFTLRTDIMKAATEVCKLPSQFYGVKYRFPKLDHAYNTIVEGDPSGICGKQDHRALSDARMASYLMLQMFSDGNYVP